MSEQVLKICEDAEKLSPLERIELIEHLFYSLDSKEERGRIDAMWVAESEDRLSAYESGEMKSVPLREVLDQIESSR